MAEKVQNKKEALPMEEMLWKACDALRGSIEPSEYKHVVISLIFLKYAGLHFEKRRQEIIAAGQEVFVDNVAFYKAKNVFYLPETSRWSYLKENAKQSDIALKVDKALTEIEKENKSLAGAGYPPKIHDEVFKEILEHAENFKHNSTSRPYSTFSNNSFSVAAEQ